MHLTKKRSFKLLLMGLTFVAIVKTSTILFVMVDGQQLNKNHFKVDVNRKTVATKIINPEFSFLNRAVAAETEESQKSKKAEFDSELNLSSQWKILKEKEKELKEKEKALKELERKIQEKIAYEEELKQQIENLIKKLEVLKNKKIKHLVSVYSNMEPQQAAKVLEKLDLKLAVKILAGMRGRKAGEILSYMDPNKAAMLSKALTEFQTPFSTQ